MVRSQEGRRCSLQGRMQFERRVPVAELLTRSQREGGAGGRGAGVVGDGSHTSTAARKRVRGQKSTARREPAAERGRGGQCSGDWRGQRR